MSDPQPATPHYGGDGLVAKIEDALRRAGLGDGPIPWDALAPLDQFHVGGSAATADLAARLAIEPGARLLDIGCGLGGPCRYLAAVHGCTVTGIDLSQPFVDVATMLTRRTGLDGQVSHRHADAVRLPFAPGCFDAAWTQHVAMNIADRRALYAGIHAVLRPGGRFAIYDVVAGEAGPIQFPVPWARDAADSFLLSAPATREVLEAAGFTVLHWSDATQAALGWGEQQADAARSATALRGIALPLVMGADFPALAANLRRNIAEGRARLLQAIVAKPA